MIIKYPKAIAQMAALGLAATLPFNALAQEEKTESYVYGTYYYCDPLQEDAADSFVAEKLKPVYDQAVEDGTINAWGWLAHHTGGKWRRIQWHTSDTVEGLLSAQETIGARMDKALDGADDGFNKYCRAHDDYIWQSVAGGDGTAERGKAGISVYHVCSMAEEQRIDELFKKVAMPWITPRSAEEKPSPPSSTGPVR